MSKFFRELLIGIPIIILGIWLSVASGYFLFYGLIVVGLFSVILAFVHLNQSKQKRNDGEVLVKKFYPTDKPQEKARFIGSLDSQEALEPIQNLFAPAILANFTVDCCAIGTCGQRARILAGAKTALCLVVLALRQQGCVLRTKNPAKLCREARAQKDLE